MPETAAERGLARDIWYDGRRDVVAATSAALDYLTDLHRRFDGDWLLALAAYNAGPGRVRAAISRNRERGEPVDYWNLGLPGETRDYVPKLLALKALIEAPAAYGTRLPALPDRPQFALVDAGGPLDLAVAARLAGVSHEEVLRLNPGYLRQIVHPDGPTRLAIPEAAVTRFTERLRHLSSSDRTPWIRHRIRYGDTLSGIAERYRVPISQLRRLNQLADARIFAGDLLIVPVMPG